MSATNRARLDGKSEPYRENGAYNTAIQDCRGLIRLLPFLSTPQRILEPGVGDGNWITAIGEREERTGVIHSIGAMDINPNAPGLMLARSRGGFAMTGDFLTTRPNFQPTAIVGNPAFAEPQAPITCPKCGGLKHTTRVVAGKVKKVSCTRCGSSTKKPTGIYKPPPIPVAEKHVRRCLELLPTGGHLAFVLRLAFLETRDRVDFWKTWGCHHGARVVFPLAQRLSFMDGPTDSCAYGLFWWEKGYTGPMLCEPVDHLEGL